MDSEKLFDEANSCSENNQGGDPFGDGKSISDFTGTMPWITLVPSTSSSSEKKNSDGLTKWKKVRRACEPCRSMKLRCDEKRPCSRCVRNKRVSKCIDRSQSEIRRNSYRSNASKNSSVRIRHDNLLIRHCNSSMVFDEASINFDCFNEEENFYWLNNPLLSSHAFLSSASTSADTIDVIKLVKSYGPDRIHNILIDKAGMCKMLWYWFRNFFGQEFALRLRDEMYKDALTVATELSESILREQISKLSPEIPLIPIKWVHSTQPLTSLLESEQEKMFVRSIFNVLDFLHSDVGGIESWLFIDNKTQQVKHILRMDSQMERLLGHDFCIRDQECSTIDIEIDDPKLFPGKRFTTSSSFRKIVNFVLKFWMEGRNNFASEIHLSASELGKDDIKTFGYYHFKDYVDNLNVLELSAYLKPITETYNPSKSIGSSFDPHSLEL